MDHQQRHKLSAKHTSPMLKKHPMSTIDQSGAWPSVLLLMNPYTRRERPRTNFSKIKMRGTRRLHLLRRNSGKTTITMRQAEKFLLLLLQKSVGLPQMLVDISTKVQIHVALRMCHPCQTHRRESQGLILVVISQVPPLFRQHHPPRPINGPPTYHIETL